MSTAAIGLFESRTQAQNALQELVNAGFSRVNVQLISRNGGAAGTEDLSGQLMRMGLPDNDVRLYSSHLNGGKALVAVKTSDAEVAKAESILERNGATQLDGADETSTSELASKRTEPLGVSGKPSSQETVIPVIEEELQVGKREETRRRVRIYPRIVDEPVDEQVSLRQEHVEVQRRPVDRPVEDRDLQALKQGTVEMSETGEEAVVQKSARVVEEIVLSKGVTQENRTIHDTVRKTEVNVDEGDKSGTNRSAQTGSAGVGSSSSAAGIRSEANLGVDPELSSSTGSAGTTGMSSKEPWKEHSNEALGTMTDASTAMGDTDVDRTTRTSGGAYDEPAHRYGTMLATDPRYKGKEWGTIEPEAQREWPNHEKGAWEEFKEKVRHAWEKVSGER